MGFSNWRLSSILPRDELWLVKRLRVLTDMTVAESHTEAKLLLDRNVRSYWRWTILGCLGFSAYLFLTMFVGADWLDRLGANPWEFLESLLPNVWIGGAAQLSLTIIIFFAVPAYAIHRCEARFYRRPLHRELNRCLNEPACFACGYSLAGLDANTCPECGHTKPATTATPAGLAPRSVVGQIPERIDQRSQV